VNVGREGLVVGMVVAGGGRGDACACGGAGGVVGVVGRGLGGVVSSVVGMVV